MRNVPQEGLGFRVSRWLAEAFCTFTGEVFKKCFDLIWVTGGGRAHSPGGFEELPALPWDDRFHQM
jgi:hypothetical protein